MQLQTMKPSGIISLLTDFGDRDGYVAVMKAIVLGINPQAQLVDLSHDLGPQNLHAGAFLLSTQTTFFPTGSVHVAIVDPGVGTSRRCLAVQTGSQTYLAPDNGLLDFCLEHGDIQAVEIDNKVLWRQPVSNTFHGRDIFAPVAAHLSLGKPLREIGNPVVLTRRLRRPICEMSAGEIAGQVVYVDRFGNLITTITGRDLMAFANGEPVEISLEGRNIGALSPAYATVPAGAAVAVVGGFDRLEVAVNSGNAASRFGAGVGAVVKVRKKS